MAESRGGCGNAVLTRFRLHRPAEETSAHGQITRSFWQQCPWSRYPVMQCYSWMNNGLGSHVQRARSVRGMDESPTALAYQLPRVSSSTPGPEPPQRAPSRQGCSGPYGQHGDLCVYQLVMRLHSCRMSQLARQLLFWSQKHLTSLPAIHIPGVFNQVANELSRAALPGEWRLHPQAV